jgi:hypothetical protein
MNPHFKSGFCCKTLSIFLYKLFKSLTSNLSQYGGFVTKFQDISSFKYSEKSFISNFITSSTQANFALFFAICKTSGSLSEAKIL